MKPLQLVLLCSVLNLLACTSNENVSKQSTNSNLSTTILEIDTIKNIKISDINSSLIVIDTLTNLMWMKNDFTSIKGRFLNDWEEIFIFQREMNDVNNAGFSDWKPASISEYRTI